MRAFPEGSPCRPPVTYVGLGAGALDLVPVRARARLQSAQVLLADEVHRLSLWAAKADRVEARGLEAKEIVARLRAAFVDGQTAVRAVAGTLGESMRALDEIRLLLEADVQLEVLGAAPGDTIRWPWRDRLPLNGKRIAVTRPRAADDSFSDLLLRLGAEVVEAPTLELSPPADVGALDRAIDGLHRYGFLVLTSANGVNAFCERLYARGKDARWLTGLRLAVIGPGTAAALRGHGLVPDVSPAEFRAEALAQAMLGELGPGARVLVARNAEGRETLPVELSKAGALVDVVAAYQMVTPPKDAFASLLARIEAHELDLLTFASGASVRALVGALGVDAFAGLPIACLGPVTAEAVVAAGLQPGLIAPTSKFEDLAEAIALYFKPVRVDR